MSCIICDKPPHDETLTTAVEIVYTSNGQRRPPAHTKVLVFEDGYEYGSAIMLFDDGGWYSYQQSKKVYHYSATSDVIYAWTHTPQAGCFYDECDG